MTDFSSHQPPAETIAPRIAFTGARAVGKTSLIECIASHTFRPWPGTVGAKLHSCRLRAGEPGSRVELVDVEGLDHPTRLRGYYRGFLRGVAAYVLVVDGTRPETLRWALDLDRLLHPITPMAPTTLLVNKCDLGRAWRWDDLEAKRLMRRGLIVRVTSAKTGWGVDAAIEELRASLANPARVAS